MQIFVKTIRGDTITLADVSETVDDVKSRIEEIEGIAVDNQRLIFSGRELESGQSLSNYNIHPDSTIHLMLGLDGGLFHPKLRYLAMYHLLHKKICQKCYERLPFNAVRCSKAKCGRTGSIRLKKYCSYQLEGYNWHRPLADWDK